MILFLNKLDLYIQKNFYTWYIFKYELNQSKIKWNQILLIIFIKIYHS
jgi:hypothetical protein